MKYIFLLFLSSLYLDCHAQHVKQMQKFINTNKWIKIPLPSTLQDSGIFAHKTSKDFIEVLFSYQSFRVIREQFEVITISNTFTKALRKELKDNKIEFHADSIIDLKKNIEFITLWYGYYLPKLLKEL